MPVATRSQQYYKTSETKGDQYEPSIASELLLIVEITGSDGIHRGSLLIEQSEVQYYDFRRSDRNPHFHVMGHMQKGRYLRQLRSRAFKEVRKETFGKGRPSLYYMVLSKEYDYYLDEITVVNNVHLSHLAALVNKLPLQWVAQTMFIDEDDADMKDNRRGNKRWDAGFTGLNSTDNTLVPGMNVPGRILTQRGNKGRNESETREQTMFEMGCTVMAIADTVRSTHPRQNCIMADSLFTNKDRQEFFSRRWAEDLGLLERCGKLARFEGTSVFGTGETKDFKVLKCERHVDSGNARERGQEHSPTIVALVRVVDSEGMELNVRIGINIYQKGPCSLAYEKWTVLDVIHKCVMNYDREMMRENVPVNRRDETLHLRFEEPADLPRESSTWALHATSDKDGYYSIYANEINKIANRFGRNRAVMIECLLTIPLTPDPGSWLLGIRNAVRMYECDLNENVTVRQNIIQNYIEWMMDSHGSVSWGSNSRCQTSHHGVISKGQIYKSCENFSKVLEMANVTDDTKKIVNLLCKSAKDGGVHGVGPFYSQHLINVSIKVGLLTRVTHALNVAVATSTATYKRLRTMGIRNKRHAEVVVPYLSHVMKDSPEVAENKLCEACRRKFGVDGTMDIFARGHVLHRIIGKGVYTIDVSGKVKKLGFGGKANLNTYKPMNRWWEVEMNNVDGSEMVYLSRKRMERDM